MNDFVDNLRSPDWWLTAVLAGIFVDIAKTYLLRWGDRYFIKLAAWSQARRASSDENCKEIAAAIRGNSEQIGILSAREVRHRLSGIVLVVQAVGTALLSIVLVIVGAPYWISGPTIALFFLLWSLFVFEGRRAQHVSDVLLAVERDCDQSHS